MAKRKNGIYRAVQISFWEDAKVVDDYTPEDKYFYLYLFTNPHTNLCGCYEISKTHMSRETGYNIETISRLLERFETVHKVICYNNDEKELLLVNWHKYNWTNSDSLRTGLSREIDKIKTQRFKEFLTSIFNGGETVPIPSTDRGETVPIPSGDGGGITVTVPVTVTDTVNTVSDTVTDTDSDLITVRNTKSDNYDTIVEMFNNTCLSFPRVKTKPISRMNTVNDRLAQYSLADFQRAFEKVEASDFLKGENPRGWIANFDWIIKDENMAKILDGNYDRAAPAKEARKKNKAEQDLDDFYDMMNEWKNERTAEQEATGT